MWITRWLSKVAASVYVFCAIARNRRIAYIRTQSTSNLPSVQGGQSAQSRLRQFVERKTPWPVRSPRRLPERTGQGSIASLNSLSKQTMCSSIGVRLFRGDTILTAAGLEEFADTPSEHAIERKLAL